MNKVKVPFTSFDIFTSIIPAIILLLLSSYIYVESPSLQSTLPQMLTSIHDKIPIESKGISFAVFSLAVASLIFTLGHAIMVLASLFIDRLVIGKGFSYPYVYLFALKRRMGEV